VREKTEGARFVTSCQEDQADVRNQALTSLLPSARNFRGIKHSYVKVSRPSARIRPFELQLGGCTIYRLPIPTRPAPSLYSHAPPVGPPPPAAMINRFSGVRGDLTDDPSLNLTVINTRTATSCRPDQLTCTVRPVLPPIPPAQDPNRQPSVSYGRWRPRPLASGCHRSESLLAVLDGKWAFRPLCLVTPARAHLIRPSLRASAASRTCQVLRSAIRPWLPDEP